jgi:hypothetical protein
MAFRIPAPALRPTFTFTRLRSSSFPRLIAAIVVNEDPEPSEGRPTPELFNRKKRPLKRNF